MPALRATSNGTVTPPAGLPAARASSLRIHSIRAILPPVSALDKTRTAGTEGARVAPEPRRRWSAAQCRCRRGMAVEAVAGDHLPIPVGAVLQHALLGGVVNVDQAEALGVALFPLEVVQQRPDEVAAQVHPGGDGALRRAEVAIQEADAVGIVDLALRVGVVVEGGAVLGDRQRHRRVL